MPFVGVGHDLLFREGVHLLEDGGVRVVEPRIAEADGVGLRGDEVGEPLLDVLRAAGGDRCRRPRPRSGARRRAIRRAARDGRSPAGPWECRRRSGRDIRRRRRRRAAARTRRSGPHSTAACPTRASAAGPRPSVASQARPCAACWASSMPPASATLARTPAFADCSTLSARSDRASGALEQRIGAGRKEIVLSRLHGSRHRHPPGNCVSGAAPAPLKALRCRITGPVVKAISAAGPFNRRTRP